MAALSDLAELRVINDLLTNTTTVGEVTLFMALYTTWTQALGDLDTATEVTNANAYARLSITSNTTNWLTQTVAGVTNGENKLVLAFAQATPASWGTIQGFGLLTSGTHGAGNLILHGALSTPVTINANDTFQFAVGAFSIEVQ